jgi:hypothetical protein
MKFSALWKLATVQEINKKRVLSSETNVFAIQEQIPFISQVLIH